MKKVNLTYGERGILEVASRTIIVFCDSFFCVKKVNE